jgi:hypothetical protein
MKTLPYDTAIPKLNISLFWEKYALEKYALHCFGRNMSGRNMLL